MLIRNFLFRSSINYYLPMRRSPHTILWHHLAARRYRKFRNQFGHNNSSNNNNNNSKGLPTNAKDSEYEYLPYNSYYYFSPQHEQQPPPLPHSPPPTTTGAGVATSTEANGIDNKSHAAHITIDIDVKPGNGITDYNDNTIATLTNGRAKQQTTIGDLTNSSNTTGLRSNLSGQRSTVLCRVVLATVGVGLLAAIVTLIWYYMGWTFGLPALLVALLVLLLTKPGWRWFYIAGATAKRDLT